MEKERNYAIDTIRFIAAFCIVLHHISFLSLPEWVNNLMLLLTGWALFYFFIISGYFLGFKGDFEKRVINTVGRIAWLFVVWSSLYSLLNIVQLGGAEAFSIVISNTFLFEGTYGHLWFLSSLISCFLVCYVFVKYFSGFLISGICLLLIAAHLLLNVYHISVVPIYNMVSYLSYIPLFVFGYYSSQRKPWRLKSAIVCLLGGGFLLGFETFVADVYFDTNLGNKLLGTYGIAMGLFQIGLNKPLFLNNKSIGKIGGRYGLGIYLIQLGLIEIVVVMYNKLGFNYTDNIVLQILSPFIILGLSLLILTTIRRFLPSVYNFFTGKLTSRIG
ncbi:MAG: acyltransferase [Fibrobacterales bacterium]